MLDCIDKCRMEMRCVARPTLQMFMDGRRVWRGLISTTQALNGTRLEYLKQKYDYAEAPCSRAFALLGTFHHLRYQKKEIPNSLSEEWMEDAEGTGMFDFYDAQTEELFDFKTVGCWKICKWLGKYTIEEPTDEIFKSGPRKGQPKTKKVWALREPDMLDLKMQLSRYAWMLQDAGFPVRRAWVQATVRDYTRLTARMYGLDRPIYLIQVPLYDRETVVTFYKKKQAALVHAIEFDELPEVCEPEERWDDRRCISFCPVKKFCDYGLNLKEKEEEDGG
jgi:hypothetical protein